MRLTAVLLSSLVLMASLMTGVRAQKNPSIKVTTVIGQPYLRVSNVKNESGKMVPEYSGFIKDLLDLVCDKLNIDYTLSVRLDGSYGGFNPQNNTWTGMIGELIEQKVDMAAGAMTVNAIRSRVIDFGVPFQTFGKIPLMKKFFFKKTVSAVDMDVRLGNLFSPLEDSVWLLSGLSWFVASLVLYIVCRVNPFEWRRMVKDREATMREGESFSCVNSYWFMLGAIFWQGFMRSPRSMGGRVVVTFWWLYAFIFVAVYIASLTNYLRSELSPAVTIDHKRFQSVEEIADDPSVVVSSIKNGSTSQYFKTSPKMKYEMIWERMSKDKSFVRRYEEGIKKVSQSTAEKQHAFFLDSPLAQYIASRQCDLYTFRHFPITGYYAFAFPADSPLSKKMNMAVLMLKESGRLDRLEKEWFNSEPCEPEKEKPYIVDSVGYARLPPFQKVDLASFAGAVILLMIGLLLGVIVTLIEIFLFKYAAESGDSDHEDLHEKEKWNKDKGDNQDGQPMTDV